jgi:hypothetical protein
LRQSQLLSLWAQENSLQASCFAGLWVETESRKQNIDEPTHEKKRSDCADTFILEHACLANPKKMTKELKPWQAHPCELRSELQHTPPDLVKKLQPFLQQKGSPNERRTLLLSNDGNKNWLLVLRAKI